MRSIGEAFFGSFSKERTSKERTAQKNRATETHCFLLPYSEEKQSAKKRFGARPEKGCLFEAAIAAPESPLNL
jgi:hypothetical protein